MEVHGESYSTSIGIWLVARNSDVTITGGAIGRTYAACYIVEVSLAMRVVDRSPFFTANILVVILASVFRGVQIEGFIAEFPWVTSTTSVRSGLGTIKSVIAESWGTVGFTDAAGDIIESITTFGIHDGTPLFAALIMLFLTSLSSIN